MKLFYPARLSLFILLLLAGINVCSQCSMYPVPFEQRVNQAAYIVQGKVTEQHCYIDRATGYVNTLNKFRVSAWLKNYSADEYIYIITLGGVYGDKAMVVTPALQLDTHHEYLLMLEADKHVLDDEQFRALHPSAMQLMAYADAQGSLTNENNLYHDLYYKTPRPETKLFAEISRMTGQSAVKPSGEPFVPREVIQPANNGITAISSFSPNPTNAGTIVAGDQLTITGSGFGAAAGTVFYSNANDGGATFTASGVASDNVSWADATIVNKVAVVAGTGPINVNGAMTSGTNLTVTYSHLAINSTFSGFGSTTRQRYYLVNKNSLGGYTFIYNTSFAGNTAAVAAFERSLLTWRCNTFVNFWRDNTTTSSIATAALDGTNIVTFDASLPVGVLGRATSHFSGSATGGCNLANTVWYTNEIDVQFAPDPPVAGFTWQYGPALPSGAQYDMESVATHELGHAHGLGHVIAAGDVMHYALSNGSAIRTLNGNNITAGTVKMAYSTAPLCLTPSGVTGPMAALTAVSCVLPLQLADFWGERKNESANTLRWITDREVGNSGFYLQRSTDGIHFNSIAFIAGTGNSNQPKQYEYADIQAGPFPWYYRLRQVDMGGQTTYSKTIFLDGDDRITARVWTKDAGRTINVFTKDIPGTSSALRVVNALGQQVLNQKLNNGNTEIPVGPLPNGVYYYQLHFNGRIYSGKLLLGTQ